MILDVGITLGLFFVGKYAPGVAEDMNVVIIAIQPVFVMLIAGIAIEDAAFIKSGQ